MMNLDQGVVGSIFTVIVMLAFGVAVWWALHSKNKDRFDEAANIIFEDDEKSDAQDTEQHDKQLRNKDQESSVQ